jgi:hypothetical protein
VLKLGIARDLTIRSQYFGADSIGIAILMILYLLRFDVPNIFLTICLLQRNKRSHENVLISQGNKSAENKLAS